MKNHSVDIEGHIFVDGQLVKDFKLHFTDGSVLVGSQEMMKEKKIDKDRYIELEMPQPGCLECGDGGSAYINLRVLKSINELDYSTAVRSTIIFPSAVRMIEVDLDEEHEEAIIRNEKKKEIEKLK